VGIFYTAPEPTRGVNRGTMGVNSLPKTESNTLTTRLPSQPHLLFTVPINNLLFTVTERIILKVATLTYRALHGSAPPYLASSFTCVADMPHQRRLRSAFTEQLDVPTCRRSTIGRRAFPVAGAKLWNGLPSDVTSASSLSVFKNRLKTYFFRRCYETV